MYFKESPLKLSIETILEQLCPALGHENRFGVCGG